MTQISPPFRVALMIIGALVALAITSCSSSLSDSIDPEPSSDQSTKTPQLGRDASPRHCTGRSATSP